LGGATPFEDRYIKLENQWFKLINKDDETIFQKINYDHDAFYLLVNILITRTITNRVSFNRQSITRVFMKNTEEYIKEPYISKAQKALSTLINTEILIPDKEIDSFEFRTDDIIHADVNLEFLEQDANFFRLFHSQLKEINECKNVDRAKLLCVYCTIRSHIFEDSAGYRIIENLVNDTGLVKNTITKYVNTLAKSELIVYKNPGTRYSESKDRYKEAPNFFTYPSVDANKLLEDAISDYIISQKRKGYILINNKETKIRMNKRRSNTSKRKYYDNQYKEDKISQEEHKTIIKECDAVAHDLLPNSVKKHLVFEKQEEDFNKTHPENIKGDGQNVHEDNKTQSNGWGKRHDPFDDVDEQIDDYEDEFKVIVREQIENIEEEDEEEDLAEIFSKGEVQTRDIVPEEAGSEEEITLYCNDCNKKLTDIKSWGKYGYNGYCINCKDWKDISLEEAKKVPKDSYQAGRQEHSRIDSYLALKERNYP
jgi:hypothetical protein